MIIHSCDSLNFTILSAIYSCLHVSNELNKYETDCDVLGIDANKNSIAMLNSKARAAGLSNVIGRCQWIQEVPEEADIALALHACGAASDFALLQAARARAAFSVCPCCVGKLKFKLQLQAQQQKARAAMTTHASAAAAPPTNIAAADEEELEDEEETQEPAAAALQSYRPRVYYPDAPADVAPLGDNKRVFKDQIFVTSGDRSTIAEDVEHPRSAWMRGLLGDAESESDAVEKYSLIARAGDISHAEKEDEDAVHHRAPQLALAAKTLLELDRVHSMRERGYDVLLLKTVRGDEYTKSDLLVGWPIPKAEPGSVPAAAWGGICGGAGAVEGPEEPA